MDEESISFQNQMEKVKEKYNREINLMEKQLSDVRLHPKYIELPEKIKQFHTERIQFHKMKFHDSVTKIQIEDTEVVEKHFLTRKLKNKVNSLSLKLITSRSLHGLNKHSDYGKLKIQIDETNKLINRLEKQIIAINNIIQEDHCKKRVAFLNMMQYAKFQSNPELSFFS